MENKEERLSHIIDKLLDKADEFIDNYNKELKMEEVGIVVSVSRGIAKVKGLFSVCSDELVLINNENLAMVFNMDEEFVSVILFNDSSIITSGMEVKRLHRFADVPVGESLLGRVISPIGIPLDELGDIVTATRYPIERESAAIMDRSEVCEPMQTGILAIDALIPIGRGQRQLIIGDRQIGKTAIAIDTIINQKNKNVICVYCSIGQQSLSVAKVIETLKQHNSMEYTVVVSSSAEDTPGMNYIAPYAASSIAEYFMEQGKDVLIVYDALSHHARSYRELSLLMRRPPAREAFPGDIFYIHSRLLERATHLSKEKGGGSLTALPIVETEAQNLSAYIPTNLVSITDGQIYLTPKLFQNGIMPSVDVGKSVSRVGGKAQLPAYRETAGNLRLAYAQFEELEIFERFSTKIDEETKKILNRGHKIREVLKQKQYSPISVANQIILLTAVTNGLLDEYNEEQIIGFKDKIKEIIKTNLNDLEQKILLREKLTDEDKKRILQTLQKLIY